LGAEAGRLKVEGQLGLWRETLSQKNKNKSMKVILMEWYDRSQIAFKFNRTEV
jgi:hypothetical protein